MPFIVHQGHKAKAPPTVFSERGCPPSKSARPEHCDAPLTQFLVREGRRLHQSLYCCDGLSATAIVVVAAIAAVVVTSPVDVSDQAQVLTNLRPVRPGTRITMRETCCLSASYLQEPLRLAGSAIEVAPVVTRFLKLLAAWRNFACHVVMLSSRRVSSMRLRSSGAGQDVLGNLRSCFEARATSLRCGCRNHSRIPVVVVIASVAAIVSISSAAVAGPRS